jgi:hypothetical protein
MAVAEIVTPYEDRLRVARLTGAADIAAGRSRMDAIGGGSDAVADAWLAAP